MYGYTPYETTTACKHETTRDLYSIFTSAASGRYDGTTIGRIRPDRNVKIGYATSASTTPSQNVPSSVFDSSRANISNPSKKKKDSTGR